MELLTHILKTYQILCQLLNPELNYLKLIHNGKLLTTIFIRCEEHRREMTTYSRNIYITRITLYKLTSYRKNDAN